MALRPECPGDSPSPSSSPRLCSTPLPRPQTLPSPLPASRPTSAVPPASARPTCHLAMALCSHRKCHLPRKAFLDLSDYIKYSEIINLFFRSCSYCLYVYLYSLYMFPPLICCLHEEIFPILCLTLRAQHRLDAQYIHFTGVWADRGGGKG